MANDLNAKRSVSKLIKPFFVIVTIVAMLVLWGSLPWLMTFVLKHYNVQMMSEEGEPLVSEPQQFLGTFGDMYGVLNCLFSGFAMLGALYAIFLQRKELEENHMLQVNAMQSATYSQIMGRLNDILNLEMQHHDTPLFSKLSAQYEITLTLDARLRHYFFKQIILFEEVYQQHNIHNLLSKPLWDAWRRRITNSMKQPGLAGYWKCYKEEFGQEFTQDFVVFIETCISGEL